MKVIELPEVEKEIYWMCMNSPKSVYEIVAGLGKYSVTYVNQLCNLLVARKLMTKIIGSNKKSLYQSIEQRENGEM